MHTDPLNKEQALDQVANRNSSHRKIVRNMRFLCPASGFGIQVIPVVVCSLCTQLRLFMSHLFTNTSVVFFQITLFMVSSYLLVFLAPSSSSSIAVVSLAKFVLFLLHLIHVVVTVRFVPLRFSAHVCFVGSLPSSDWPTLYRTFFLYPSSPNCLLHSTVSNFLHQILVHTCCPFDSSTLNIL